MTKIKHPALPPLFPKTLTGIFFVFWTFFFSCTAHAEKILRWGGDSEGGAPFVFQDPKNLETLIGFEVDLAEALAKELGMQAEFVQNQWDALVPGLKRKNYDIILNGLEITDDRKEEIAFSEPYYITSEQLTVRKDNYTVKSLDDLNKKKVGTLKNSLAERILKEHKGIKVITYDDDTNPYKDLALKRLDAVLMDLPIAVYRAAAFKELKFVGDPIGEVHYGIGVRKNAKKLLHKIDIALTRLGNDGELRRILEKWNLWNPAMAKLIKDPTKSTAKPTGYNTFLDSIGVERENFKTRLIRYAGFLPLLGKGAITTLRLSVSAMLLAMAMGMTLALIRLYGPKPFSQLSIWYIEIIRGTPLLIQLYVIYYGLPNFGILLSPVSAAILGLGLNYAAFEAENYRAGILSISQSQYDAGLALGLSHRQTVRHVILPQAIRLILPPLTNDFIALLKDSSLVSVITMVELTKVYGQLAATHFDYLGIGILTAMVYFLIGLPFVKFSRYAEKKFAAGSGGMIQK